MFAVPADRVSEPGRRAGVGRSGAGQPGRRRASAGHLSVTIDAMTPPYAKPGATVTVSGTVTNGTRRTQAGLAVRLFTSASHFVTRDEMDSYTSRGEAPGLAPAGDSFLFSASVAPGRTASWTASFQVSTQGISSFGVYPVTAQLQDLCR